MKLLIPAGDYTFDASAKTVTFDTYGSIDIEGVLLITNLVDNIIIYNFSDSTLGGTAATNILTLTYDTTSMSDTDELQIWYEDPTATLPLGTVTIAEPVSVDDNGGSLTIDASSLPLPTGASTSANQTTIIGYIDGIETLLGTIDADTSNISTKIDTIAGAVSGTEMQVDVLTLPSVTLDAGTLSALELIGIKGADGAAIVANANPLPVSDAGGSLTIDGTIAATQSGTWNITNISGTVSLPTGAATEVKQDTQITSLQSIDTILGNVNVTDDAYGKEILVVGGWNQTESKYLPLSVVRDQSDNNNAPLLIGGHNAENTGKFNVLNFFQLTNSKPIVTALVDGNGDQITSFGGGVEYVEDTPHNSGDTGKLILAVSKTSGGALVSTDGDYTPLQTDDKGNLRVIISDDVTGIAASLAVIDDWDESDRAKVNTIVGQTGVQGGSGTVSANTQRVVLATDVALPAGTNAIGKLAANSGVDIGDVDITSIAAGDNVIGRVKLSDGTDVADILDLTNSNPLTVAIVDSNGDQITSFGGGTQYTEGDTDASITGTAMLMEVAANALQPIQGTVADGLLVNLGANNDVVISGTVAVTQSGTWDEVGINDSGNSITVDDGGASLTVDGTVAFSNTTIAVTNVGTFAVQVDGDALTSLQLIDDIIATIGSGITSKGATIAGTDGTNARVIKTDASGELQVDILSVIPGTGATNLGKAEDDAHNSGDTGIQTLAVRKGTPANLSGTDGDYEPLQVNNGALWTSNLGFFATCSTDVTRPADTTAYAVNDALSDSTSSPTSGGFTFTSAARKSGGSGIITDAIITTSADAGTLLQGEIWIFNTSVTNINDNSAFAVSDSEIKTCIGKIPFTLEDAGNNGFYHAQNLSIGFTCSGSANLRFLVKVKNAYTPASAEVLTFVIKVIQVD